MNCKKRISTHKFVTVLLAAAMVFAALPLFTAPAFADGNISVSASGRIADDEVNLRKGTNTSTESLCTLSRNTKLTIHREIFKDIKDTSASQRWYYVTAGKRDGYVRADFVKDISYGNAAASSTDALNYRNGPATSFRKLGTVAEGTSITLQLPARLSGHSDIWYRAVINGSTAYINGRYAAALIRKSSADLSSKSELAKALLASPTRGGKARVVYTFTPENCKKLFPITGTRIAKVPQGFTFTGSEYHIVYGMAAGQSVVTYSADGKRLGASDFSFCIGHPNGITWDPVTRMCYVFKGNQKTIYTWNPSTKKFGKAKTPYSSSGVGYDNATGLIYATSHTGIRAYSADGSFDHKSLFSRCSPGFFHYIQDCGAGEGFIFHGISGANKRTQNQLDIYRAADKAYLGSIKIDLGEIESAAVGSDGYLNLLINTMGDDTDYIWRTPLNVKELK